MKGIKKLLTGILAATMIMGASLTAFAAEDTSATASLTINNTLEAGQDGAVKKIKYTYYQFLKAEVLSLNNEGAAQSGEVVYYVETKELADALEGTGCFVAAKATAADRWYITAAEGKSGDDIVAALSNMTGNAIATGTFETAEGKKSAQVDLPAGYYLILSSLGTKAAVQTVGNVTIDEKNEETTVEKKENKTVDSMYDNADPVVYTVTIHVPEAPAEKEIVVVDTATKGLTFEGTARGNNGKTYTWSAATEVNGKNQYTIDIPATDVLAAAGSDLVLTYSAVINKDAVVFTPETNSAHIIYDNNASAETTPVSVKTLGIKIIKYTVKNGKNESLTGAEFKLYADNNGKKGDEIKVVKVSDGVYRVADSNNAKEVIADTIAVDANGNAEVLGLNAKNYKLEEVKAPAGYTMLDHLVDITVSSSLTELLPVEVLNQTGATLPSTGGMGTTIFYIVGAILIVAGVAYFIVRRKASVQ